MKVIFHIGPFAIYFFGFMIMIGAIVGMFVLKREAKQIFAIHQGGLSIHGGLVGGFLAAFWFLKKHKLSFLAVADLASPPLILAQAIARTGCDVSENKCYWGTALLSTIILTTLSVIIYYTVQG